MPVGAERAGSLTPRELSSVLTREPLFLPAALCALKPAISSTGTLSRVARSCVQPVSIQCEAHQGPQGGLAVGNHSQPSSQGSLTPAQRPTALDLPSEAGNCQGKGGRLVAT